MPVQPSPPPEPHTFPHPGEGSPTRPRQRRKTRLVGFAAGACAVVGLGSFYSPEALPFGPALLPVAFILWIIALLMGGPKNRELGRRFLSVIWSVVLGIILFCILHKAIG